MAEGVILSEDDFKRLGEVIRWVESQRNKQAPQAITSPAIEPIYARTTSGTSDADGHYPAVITLYSARDRVWNDYSSVLLMGANNEVLTDDTRYLCRAVGRLPSGIELFIAVAPGGLQGSGSGSGSGSGVVGGCVITFVSKVCPLFAGSGSGGTLTGITVEYTTVDTLTCEVISIECETNPTDCCPQGSSGSGSGPSSPPVSTLGCPSRPVPASLHLQVSGCSCVFGLTMPMNYTASGSIGAGWYTAVQTCGPRTLQFVMQAVGTKYRFTEICAGVSHASGDSTAASCDPFQFNGTWSPSTLCCVIPDTFTITE